MTNRQWLMNEIQNMSDEELADLREMHDFICVKVENCKENDGDCEGCKLKWLKSEHKEIPKISDAERVILENVPKRFEWIVRSNGELFLYIDKPYKVESGGYWDSKKGYISLGIFSNLFQFIKWEDAEPYNIEELLKGK